MFHTDYYIYRVPDVFYFCLTLCNEYNISRMYNVFGYYSRALREFYARMMKMVHDSRERLSEGFANTIKGRW